MLVPLPGQERGGWPVPLVGSAGCPDKEKTKQPLGHWPYRYEGGRGEVRRERSYHYHHHDITTMTSPP